MNTNHLRRDFFKYTLLNIISSVGMSIYILADTFFIAKGMGADGLAALNLCLPVFNFINGFGLMFGMGGGSLFSIVYSSTNRNETYKIYTNAFLSLMMITAVFEIIGIFFSKQFTMLLGADEKIFDMAHSYLKMVLLFSPAFLINNLTVCFMRNDSAPKLATFAMLFSNFYNLVLDYEFIIEKNMGMFGAALATCISPLISLIIMSFHFIFRWNTFGLKKMPMSWKMIKNIISLGFHSFVTEISGGVVIALFNSAIYRLTGNTGIAAYGVIANTAIVVTAIFNGIGTGVQPLMCKLHGEDNEREMRAVLHWSVILSLVIAGGGYSGMYLFRNIIVNLFNGNNDIQLQKIAENGLKLYFLYMPFMAINSILSVYFNSRELPVHAQIISLLRGTILVIPLLFVLPSLRGMDGLWLTIPAAELSTMIISVIIYIYYMIKRRRTMIRYFSGRW